MPVKHSAQKSVETAADDVATNHNKSELPKDQPSSKPQPSDSLKNDITIDVNLDDMPANAHWEARAGEKNLSPYGELDGKLFECFFQVKGKIIQSFLDSRGDYGHSITIEISDTAADSINSFCGESPAGQAPGYKKPVGHTKQIVFKYIGVILISSDGRCSECKLLPKTPGQDKQR